MVLLGTWCWNTEQCFITKHGTFPAFQVWMSVEQRSLTIPELCHHYCFESVWAAQGKMVCQNFSKIWLHIPVCHSRHTSRFLEWLSIYWTICEMPILQFGHLSQCRLQLQRKSLVYVSGQGKTSSQVCCQTGSSLLITTTTIKIDSPLGKFTDRLSL